MSPTVVGSGLRRSGALIQSTHGYPSFRVTKPSVAVFADRSGSAGADPFGLCSSVGLEL